MLLTENIWFWQLAPDFSTSNSCGDSPYWHEWYTRLRFAFFFIFLFYFTICLPIFYWWARRRTANTSKLIPWYTYGVAMVFMFLYLFLAVVAEGLLDCQKFNALKYAKLWGAVTVFRNIANVIILGIVALPIVTAMTKHAGFHPELSKIAHMIMLFFVACFMLIYVVIWDYNLVHSVTLQKIVDKNYGIPATYVTLYLVAALTAGSHLMASCFRMRKQNLDRSGVFPFSGLLAISLILMAMWDFIPVFAYDVVTRDYGKSPSSAFVILGLWFQAFVFTFAACISMSKALADSAARETAEHAHEEKERLPETNGHANGTQV